MKLVTAAMALGVAAVGTFALAASTPSPLGPPPPPGAGLAAGQCLQADDMQNHSVVDKNTLLVDAGRRSKGLYRFTMQNGCLRGAISSDPINVEPLAGGRICGPKDVVLRARGGHCDIASIVKLTPQEAAALPRKLKP